jgi:hypothetical protein
MPPPPTRNEELRTGARSQRQFLIAPLRDHGVAAGDILAGQPAGTAPLLKPLVFG